MNYDKDGNMSQSMQVEAPSVFTDVQGQSEYTKTDANEEQKLMERHRVVAENRHKSEK